MTTDTVCPKCNGQCMRNDYLVQLREITEEKGAKLIRSNTTPSGMEFIFEKEGRLLLASDCDSCDLTAIREFLTRSK